MSKFSRRLIYFTLLFSCWFTVLVFGVFPEPAAAQQSQPDQEIAEAIAKSEIPSPLYACWNLSYQSTERELKLEGDRGTLSTLGTKPSTVPVKVSDVDTDGWLRRQMFLWSNRLKQRSTTEYELAQVKQRIESGSLNGAALERAKQLQQTLQTLLSDPNAQDVMLKNAKTDVVKGFQQVQQRIESESKSAQQQLEEQIKQRMEQIRAALSDKNQQSQLDEQIKQINEAIGSGQLKGDQLEQAKRALSELQLLKSNPNSIEKRAKEFRDRQLEFIQSRKQSLFEQAQSDLSKQMLMLDNLDNVLVVITSQSESDRTRKTANFSPQAFSMQLKDGNYSAKTCNVQGECFPVEVKACSSR